VGDKKGKMEGVTQRFTEHREDDPKEQEGDAAPKRALRRLLAAPTEAQTLVPGGSDEWKVRGRMNGPCLAYWRCV
jgi:hypothetical protein